MHKEFKATYLYIIKAVMLFAAMITAFLAFNFGMMLLNVILPVWLIYIVNIIFALFTLVFSFMLITSKKPGFIFNDHGFKYKRKTVEYDSIKELIKAKGGSEPEIIFHNDESLVLELSWFLKKDREEIEHIIASNIK